MPNNDNNNRKKPTDTKVKHDWGSFGDSDDLSSPDDSNLPSSPNKPDDAQDNRSGNAPDFRHSSRANTRAKTGNITPGDTMRDFLNRIDRNQDDEISDDEAARRAGYSNDDEVIPDQPEADIVVHTAADVPAVIANAMQAAGVQDPEWHTINNLPAYMQRAIRGMGRKLFGMMTRTDLEDIQTIANVEGQGPNSPAELNAVLGWLRDNAEDLGEVEVGHGQAIPGYNPSVREYRTNDVRFHVVMDQMGKYIYAWPERDSKNQDNNRALPGNTPRLRESEMKQISLAEQIRTLANRLDEQELYAKWNKSLLESLSLNESTLSVLIGDSPGGQALTTWVHKGFGISNTADFEEITKGVADRLYLRQFKEYEDQVVVVQCTGGVVAFKPHEEFYKQRRADPKFGPEHDFRGDTTTLYTIVGFRKDQRVDNLLLPDPKLADMKEKGVKQSTQQLQAALDTAKEQIERRRATVLNQSAPPTVFKITRGGQPFKNDPNDNFFDRIKEVLGQITRVLVSSQSFSGIPKKDVKGFVKGEYQPGIVPAPTGDEDEDHYISGPYTGDRTRVKGSIERDKTASRAANRPGEIANPNANATDIEALTLVFKRVRPVLHKLGNQALEIIKRRMTNMTTGGNFEGATKAAQAATKIQGFLRQIDTQGEIDFADPRFNEFRRQVQNAISRKATDSGLGSGTELIRTAAEGGYVELKPILDAFRDMLIGVGT